MSLPCELSEQTKKSASRGPFSEGIWNYSSISDSPGKYDLIFVLAGMQERKIYGLDLFHKGLAPRLILSVGRFEVRKMDLLGFQDLNLRAMAAHMLPADRHFFVDLSGDARLAVPAGLPRVGTYGELSALASYLNKKTIHSLALISTSTHLRRVRWCCRKIGGLRRLRIFYLSVPEELSSFRRDRWWRKLDHCSLTCSEFVKLLGYWFRFRGD